MVADKEVWGRESGCVMGMSLALLAAVSGAYIRVTGGRARVAQSGGRGSGVCARERETLEEKAGRSAWPRDAR